MTVETYLGRTSALSSTLPAIKCWKSPWPNIVRAGTLPARIRCRTTLVLYLPVSATLQGIGDDPVVVCDKRGFVPLRKTSKNRIWDCGLLGSTHRIVFGGEKSWKQLRSSRGTRHDDDDGEYLMVHLWSSFTKYYRHIRPIDTKLTRNPAFSATVCK